MIMTSIKIFSKKTFFILIFLQLFLIIFILLYLSRPDLNVQVTDSKVKGEYTNRSRLKYFYEPIPYQSSINTVPHETQNVQYLINSEGLNDLGEYSKQKADNVYRILVFGDSFTFGTYVNTAESYPEVLEKNLINSCKSKKIEVLNFGVQGYDLEFMIERMRLKGNDYNPDLVIFLLKENDVNRIFSRTLDRFAGMISNKTKIPLENLPKEAIQFGTNDFGTEEEKTELFRIASNEVGNEISEQEIINHNLRQLEELKVIYPKKVLITSFPDGYKNTINIKKSFENFVNENKNFDFYEALPNINEEHLTIKNDLHPNVEGHRQIAKSIKEYLVPNYSLCE